MWASSSFKVTSGEIDAATFIRPHVGTNIAGVKIHACKCAGGETCSRCKIQIQKTQKISGERGKRGDTVGFIAGMISHYFLFALSFSKVLGGICVFASLSEYWPSTPA